MTKTMSSTSRPLRFPSLKTFKFSTANAPPPVPAKDSPAYTLPSSSSPSLLRPPTPVSPNCMRSPSPPPATPSLTPSTSASLSPESYSSTFKKGLIRLAKRSLTPKSSSHNIRDAGTLPDTPDDSISMPWNFQHNIHVDETYNGLPPTWSASLANLGYSEEEIEAISYRRAASRSPSTNPYQLSRSPSNSTLSGLTHPKPQSIRLQRQASLGSQTPKRVPRQSSDTNTSLQPSEHSFIDFDTVLPPLPIPTNGHMTEKSVDSVPYPNQDRSRPQPSTSARQIVQKSRPQTPPQETFQAADSTSETSSPPPAYRSPGNDAPLNTVEDELFLPSLEQAHAGPSIPSRRTNSPLLRLSLGNEAFADISSWSESLLSSVSGSTSPASDITSRQPPSSPGRWTKLLPARPEESLQKPGTVSPQNSAPGLDSPTKPQATSSPPWSQNVRDIKRPEDGSPVSSCALASISQVLEGSSVDNGGLELDDSGRGRENRDSSVSTATVTTATIVRGIELATMARANVIASPASGEGNDHPVPDVSVDAALMRSGATELAVVVDEDEELFAVDRSPSPGSLCNSHSSFASSSSSSMRSVTRPSSMSSGSSPQTASALVHGGSKWEVDGQAQRVLSGVYLGNPEPSPSGKSQSGSIKRIASLVDIGRDDDSVVLVSPPNSNGSGPKGLSIQVDDLAVHASGRINGRDASDIVPSPWKQSLSTVPPAPRYRGWLSEVLAFLDEFINDKVDPRDYFHDLREIAEGESGYVYEAHEMRSPIAISPILSPGGSETGGSGGLVAIKAVPILPSGSPKLTDLKKELDIMKDVNHMHVLTMDALYVDLVEDSLWIKMELMERSLADVVSLVEEGIVVQERVIARFAGDIVVALIYLQKLGIAHRDIRSDNLLLNKDGVLKIADFSNAVRVTPESPNCSDMVGVIYWQAPEVRRGSYNPLKADMWSLGATVWEMAQAEPPFNEAADVSDLGDRWPPLRQPEIYTRAFHDFLHLCSHPVSSRPGPEALLTTPFIRSAAQRPAIVQLLEQCKTLEENLQLRESHGSRDSRGTVSH